MLSLAPYFINLLALYLFVDRLRVEYALAAAARDWGLAAGRLIVF
jgi:uncharacterized membrane protein (GlpM family)